MEARLKLDALLRKVLREATGKENLYFQPPAGYKLKYPLACTLKATKCKSLYLFMDENLHKSENYCTFAVAKGF